jgi:hypothetical protein
MYFPFWVLVLMIVSRSSLFDYFDYPWALMAIQGGMLLALIVNAMSLHHQVGLARRLILSRLRDFRCAAIARRDDVRERQLTVLTHEVEQEREGAFNSLAQHPIFKAIAIPMGGTTAILLLETFFR